MYVSVRRVLYVGEYLIPIPSQFLSILNPRFSYHRFSLSLLLSILLLFLPFHFPSFSGELVFFGYRLDRKPFAEYSVVSPKGELVLNLDVGMKKPSMMHDFAITKSYSIM